MKGFALRLVLKQRHKRTRKWPILLFSISLQNSSFVCHQVVQYESKSCIILKQIKYKLRGWILQNETSKYSFLITKSFTFAVFCILELSFYSNQFKLRHFFGNNLYSFALVYFSLSPFIIHLISSVCIWNWTSSHRRITDALKYLSNNSTRDCCFFFKLLACNCLMW